MALQDLKIQTNNSTLNQWKQNYNDLVDELILLKESTDSFDTAQIQQDLDGKVEIDGSSTMTGPLLIGDGIATFTGNVLQRLESPTDDLYLEFQNQSSLVRFLIDSDRLRYVADGVQCFSSSPSLFETNVATNLAAGATVNGNLIVDVTRNSSGLQNGLMTTTQFTKLQGIETGAQVNVATNLALTGAGDTKTITSSTGTNVTVPVASGTDAGLLSFADKNKLDGIESGAQANVATNLALTGTGNARTITSSTGTDVSIPVSTVTNAGFMSTGDKTKLDGIEAGAEVNVGTDLSLSGAGDVRTVTSSTGTNVTIPVATTSNAGLMSFGDKVKLDGIDAGAEANVGTNLGLSGSGDSRSITSSTGTNVSIPIATVTNAGFFGTADKSKLDGIDAGAQVNVATNLALGGSGNSRTITSSTGSDVSIPLASASTAGFLSTGNYSKLIGIEDGADNYGWWDLEVNGTKVREIASGMDVNFQAGSNVTIGWTSLGNVVTINATDTNTTYSAGTGLNLVGTAFFADFMEFSSVTAAATDQLIFLDASSSNNESRARFTDIPLSLFNNDLPGTNLGYNTATTSGTVTSSTGTNATIPAATTGQAGLVTTGAQTWSGTKTSTDFVASSDRRLKYGINTLPKEYALDIVNMLVPSSFNWKEDSRFDYGLIAQEVESYIPEMVHTDDNGMKAVNYAKLTTFLIGAVQDLTARIKILETPGA